MEIVLKKNIYHKKSGIYFAWATDTQSYEPVMYDCYFENGELYGTEIVKGSIFYDFIAFIRFSSMITDKKTGKKSYGNFEIYQWAIAFNLIKLAMKLDSSKAMTAISRQAGKTYSARKIIAFLLIFLPNFITIPEDRYYCILCSPKNDLIEDHMTKMQPDIDRAIELFNTLYPMSPIISGLQDKRLKDRLKDKEYDRIVNGEQIHYSQIIGLSLQNNVVNAGYSAHLLFLDEAQEINNSSFKQQVQPFVTRTGGITYALGTTLPDDSNVLYNFYKDKTIIAENKFLYNWEEVYKCKKAVNEDFASKYKHSIEQEIANYGVTSEYVQTQYYCSFNVRGGRFITKEELERFEIMKGNIADNISEYNTNPLIYRIAAYDPAVSEDYAALVIGVAVKLPNENRFKVALKNCYALNTLGIQESSEKLLDKVVSICMDNDIDMIITDSTAAQKDRARKLVEKFQQQKAKILVVPFSYSNQNKQRMMAALSDSITAQDLILPDEKYTETHPAYKELVDELLYLQVSCTTSGTVTYKAPSGTSFHDDFVMALAQLNYCCIYVNNNKGKDIDFGDGLVYKLRFNRNEKNNVVNTFTMTKIRVGYYRS